MSALGCGRRKQEFRIGVVLSLTGSLSWVGNYMKKAAELRAEIINSRGLLKGHPLRLIFCDDQSSPGLAAKAAERLITRGGVSAIIGTTSQTISSAVAPVGNVCRIPIITTSGFDIDHSKDFYIFNTSHKPEIMVNRSFQYLQEKGVSSVVLLMPISLLGELGSSLARKLGEKYGIRILAQESFNPNSLRLKKHLTRLRAYEPQAVFAYTTGEPAARVAKAMADIHLNVPLLVSHGNANSGFLEAVRKLPVHLLVPGGQTMSPDAIPKDNPCRRVISEFNETHLRRYGLPADYCSAASSDAVGLVAEGFRLSGSFEGPDLREALEKMAFFEGMEGVYKFSEEDHYGRGLETMVVLQLKEGAWHCNKMEQAFEAPSSIQLSQAVQLMERLNRRFPQYCLLSEDIEKTPSQGKAGSIHDTSSRTYHELKQDFMNAVGLRVFAKSREILSRILGHLLCRHLDNPDMLKGWVTELFVSLSQALQEEQCVNPESLEKLKIKAISELGRASTTQSICFQFLMAVEELFGHAGNLRHKASHEALWKALNFIEQNYNTPLTVERIAQEVCLSPSRLSHLIKEEYNLTLGHFIVRSRIKKSKQLLRSTDMPISMIAQEVGYSDQSYFTKVFKKVENCTPARFRREALKQPMPPIPCRQIA